MSPHIHSHPSGVTIVVLSVVSSMLLSLISVLFMSAKYYREVAGRSACIVELGQYQKAVRAYQNLNGLAAGDSISPSDFYGEANPYRVEHFCPLGGGKYKLLGEVPSTGVAFATCTDYDESTGTKDKTQAHTPKSLSGW